MDRFITKYFFPFIGIVLKHRHDYIIVKVQEFTSIVNVSSLL